MRPLVSPPRTHWAVPEFFPIVRHGRKGRAELARLSADAACCTLEGRRDLYDGNTFCHERFKAIVLFDCPILLFNGHMILEDTVASQHQITAKLAERKMLTCFTFRPTVSVRVLAGWTLVAVRAECRTIAPTWLMRTIAS